jgi:tetratricopeptide (TPR) repeat protein
VLKAMEKNPAERYATAKELADDLERFLRDEPIRARRPSLARRARKWARRHRPAVSAAVVCLLVTLAMSIGTVGWAVGNRAARQREAEGKVREALEAAAPGRKQGNAQDPELVGAAKRAEAQLNSGVVGPEVRRQVEQLLRDVDMLARLDGARLKSAEVGERTTSHFALAGADELYAAAFTAYGADVLGLEPQEAVERVRQSQISARLIAALDDWAMIRDILQDRGGLPIHKVINRVDEDPWRRRMRVARGRRDRAALEELARGEEVMSQPPAPVVLLARTLATDLGCWAAAERLLRRVQSQHEGDFWINFELGSTLDRKSPPDWADAARFYQAALALRPESAVACNNLGVALKEQGKPVEAEVAFRRVIELQPDYVEAYNNLGVALIEQGKPAEAEMAYRKAIERKHDYPTAHRNLGRALFDLGRLDEAIAEFQEALRLDPKHVAAQNNLGVVLLRQGRVWEALAAFQAAVRLDPGDVQAHKNLGAILEEQGRLEEAIEEFRNAIKLKPRYAGAHYGLGNALKAKGNVDAAIHEYRRAIECDPGLPVAHFNLANALLHAKQDVDGAVYEYRRAIECDPKDTDAYCNLAAALARKGQADEATATLQEARRLKPRDHIVPAALAEMLFRQRRFAEARQAARDALDLLPVDNQAQRRAVTDLLEKCERLLVPEVPSGTKSR